MYVSHVPSKLLANMPRVPLSKITHLASCKVPSAFAAATLLGSTLPRSIVSRTTCSWPGLTLAMMVNSVLTPSFSPGRFGVAELAVAISFHPLSNYACPRPVAAGQRTRRRLRERHHECRRRASQNLLTALRRGARRHAVALSGCFCGAVARCCRLRRRRHAHNAAESDVRG